MNGKGFLADMDSRVDPLPGTPWHELPMYLTDDFRSLMRVNILKS